MQCARQPPCQRSVAPAQRIAAMCAPSPGLSHPGPPDQQSLPVVALRSCESVRKFANACLSRASRRVRRTYPPADWLTAQSPINAISMPAEAAAAVSTRATASVRKYGPWRRQLEGSGGRDTRSCTRCLLGLEPGGRATRSLQSIGDFPHHTRGHVREPTVRPDRFRRCASGNR